MDITGFVVAQRNKALLLGDYGSYRKQLSRRLLVVRKKLNYSTKGRKYSAKPPVTVEDIASNHECVVLIALVCLITNIGLDLSIFSCSVPRELGLLLCI